MKFYDLKPEERAKVAEEIYESLKSGFLNSEDKSFIKYASDNDTYIRKNCYLAVGKIYFNYKDLKETILEFLVEKFKEPNEKIRQTVVNALGEIGKRDAEMILPTFKRAMKDKHHSVRNAVIGSLKKIGEVNPMPVIEFSKEFIHDEDPEVRRQAIHGVELRGRTHPEDVLPLLKSMQNEDNKKVRNMVIHVVGQISYKKDCLEKVIKDLKTWDNKTIVQECIREILETHESYKEFSYKTTQEAEKYIRLIFKIDRICIND